MMNSVNFDMMMETILRTPGTENRTLLLHACCAPCASAVLMRLKGRLKIKVFYYNPNITDRAEYQLRYDELVKLVDAINKEYPGSNIEVIEGAYEPARFLEASRGLEEAKEGGQRCEKCFALRLSETLKKAKETGADLFATTLTISPLKNADSINKIGITLSKGSAVKYLVSDFKKRNGYKQSVELSKKYGLYRQNYCGCPFSKMESMEKY